MIISSINGQRTAARSSRASRSLPFPPPELLLGWRAELMHSTDHEEWNRVAADKANGEDRLALAGRCLLPPRFLKMHKGLHRWHSWHRKGSKEEIYPIPSFFTLPATARNSSTVPSPFWSCCNHICLSSSPLQRCSHPKHSPFCLSSPPLQPRS